MYENESKKVLVLGGTGAMGVYLIPELANLGYRVDVVSLDEVESTNPKVTYFRANGKDISYLSELLKNNYDAIVDFMIYSTAEFSERFEMLLGSTSQYIFLSSYRVYANYETPIKETSPRLLDVSDDTAFLSTEDYSLYKARKEDIIRASKFSNWTIVRPAITYSKRRFQLVTLDADVVVYRALNHLPVILPKEAMGVWATMSWAGDVARMIARLVFNPLALKETYTLATAEHHTWEEIAKYYREIMGLEYIVVDAKTYLSFFGNTDGARYQLMYDRCFERIVDNSKILSATGLKQTELMPLKLGLERELSVLPKDTVWGNNPINERMNAFLQKR